MPEPELLEWARETKWRQGHVLPREAAEALTWSNEVDADATCVVVISHDCDLANDNLDVEPDVEVIVGRTVAKADGNYTWGKAPRTVHCTVTRDGVPAVIELVSTEKTTVSKIDLAQYEPDAGFVLDGKGLAVLKNWLASRYNRAAFPDAFVRRMQTTSADSKLAKQLAPHGQLISFVYFDLDAGQNIERAVGDPYSLSIVLVYSPGSEPEEAADAAEQIATAVEAAVRARFSDPQVIALNGSSG
jgi:hypothetical protein